MPSSASTRSPRSRRSSSGSSSARGEEAPRACWSTEKPQCIPDYDTPRFRLTPETFCLRQDRGRLQPPMHLLHHPEDPRPASQPHAGIGRARGRGNWSKVGVKEINLISQDTTYFGMDRGTASARIRVRGVDSSRGESLSTLLARARPDRGRFLDPAALHAPGALERRTDRRPSRSAKRSPATSTSRSSTSATTCSR